MSSKTKGSKKLRDLIRVGVFSALWIAVGWIIGCTVGFFPPIMLALPCILAIFGALILVVMLSKITIRGGILISSFLFGICLFSMAPYGLMFICTFVGGIIGEILYDTVGKNNHAGKIIGVERITGNMANASMELINTPIVVVLTIVTILCAILGYLWGEKIAAKRLAKGGSDNGKRK